jgi:diguanylate cyclase (GGDEF)-like protein/excisionase family DNA binding protein
MPSAPPVRPTDATLSVTKAARLLGVHPNTIRAWSDAGRLRYYRINQRGDRRYRLGDLHRFLASAESGGEPRPPHAGIPVPTTRRAGAAAGQPVTPPLPVHPDDPRRRLDLSVLGTLARLAGRAGDDNDTLETAAAAIRDAYGHALVAIWQIRNDELVPRAIAGSDAGRIMPVPARLGIPGRALALAADPGAADPTMRVATTWTVASEAMTPTALGVSDAQPELAVAIPGRKHPWGILSICGDGVGSLGDADLDLAAIAADTIGVIVGLAERRKASARDLHRAEALRRVAGDIGSRLDVDDILSGLVDHSMVLFQADRAGVTLRQTDGRVSAEASRGLSPSYRAAIRDIGARSLQREAVAAGRPLHATAYRDDPRGAGVRAAVVQEGIDTICSVPIIDGQDVIGTLDVYHDEPHTWTPDELESVVTLAGYASIAIRTAQGYSQMATWTAQLQSIQQLGARLARLSTVREIGLAIATELRELIDYHNARVYRRYGSDLVPVAMSGRVGVYVDETPDQLRVAVGEGITGWVAEHRVAQILPDAAADPRANTIPGTEDDLDESMLLAPMLFDDEVIGVLVLSKLGLHQFTDDDLRLLVIYASFAAQAMANADATERLHEQSEALERQVLSQRALLQITESMLTTFDAKAVLESITERLGGLIASDNIAIEVVDPISRLLVPLTARGVHADHYLEAWEPGETGVATWVVEHNEPAFIRDERTDPRVNHFRSEEVVEDLDGSLIVVPLRGRTGAIGVLTLERLGLGASFSEAEFELVQLFAAQVSIALQNAEVFTAIEVRARTDALTGLLNHGTFEEWLERHVADRTPFSLIMLDLDDFRDINNALGHQAGDRLIREIADGLGAVARESDLVFRYGGDEFAFLLPQTDAARAMVVAERARAAVLATTAPGTTWAAERVGISASVGVASYPDDGGSATSVLLAADRACFVAKRTGRDRVATADEGLALAAEFSLQAPTPVDSPTVT